MRDSQVLVTPPGDPDNFEYSIELVELDDEAGVWAGAFPGCPDAYGSAGEVVAALTSRPLDDPWVREVVAALGRDREWAARWGDGTGRLRQHLGVNSFPRITPTRRPPPAGITPISTLPEGLDHSTAAISMGALGEVQCPRVRASFPVTVEYSENSVSAPGPEVVPTIVGLSPAVAAQTTAEPPGVTITSGSHVGCAARRLSASRLLPPASRLRSHTPGLLPAQSNASVRSSAARTAIPRRRRLCRC